MEGVQVCCGICNQRFSVCCKCWRGQNYCSKVCTKEARRRLRIKAQAKYRKSQNGKLKQSKHQRKYRKERTREKIVSDHSSKVEPDGVKSVRSIGVCNFCGFEVSEIELKKSNKLFSFRNQILQI